MNIPQDKINSFAINYNLVNRSLAEKYISDIEVKSKDLNKDELIILISEYKLNLSNNFEKNISIVSEELKIDFNVMVENPLIKGNQILLKDAVIVIIVAPITESIIKAYEEKTKAILDSL